MNNNQGIVFNIQKYSIHDGPGIRTLVFLKGCPLKCAWCSNPESQAYQPEIAYKQSSCLSCKKCVKICPVNALSYNEDKILIDRAKCNQCKKCVEVCASNALICYGDIMTTDEVIDKVEQDSIFYARSGGGMTLSGGEPLFQPEFAISLLKEAYERRINRAIETCGYTSQEVLLEACNYANYVLFDIKHSDSDIHKQFTSVDNIRILSNLEVLRNKFPKLKIHIRTPVIPSVNDSEKVISEIAKIAKEIKACNFELLPYHKAGTIKYSYLDKIYTLEQDSIEEEKIIRLKNMAKEVFSS